MINASMVVYIFSLIRQSSDLDLSVGAEGGHMLHELKENFLA